MSAAEDPESAELLERIGWAQIMANEKRTGRRNFWIAFAFMLPAILMVAVILHAPVVYNVYLSFTKWKKFTGLDEYAGFDNYIKLVDNRFFSDALYNTSLWVGASIVFPLLFGLGLAVFLRGVAFENTIKTIIFLPRILAPTAVGVIWFYVYAPSGVVNRFLSFFSGGEVDIGWLYQAETITPAIIVTFVWQTVGLVMVLILLGLAAIPKDPLEAARIDGASNTQIFAHIILPLLLPTLLVVTILSVLAGFTVFDLLWVMGVSFPDQRTLSLAVFMYFEAFGKGSWAFGSAIAVVIGIVALSVTWVQAYLQTRADRLTK
ncbi:MAG: sugar ABC transporter permease [Hyphomicrobiales bacterium]|nr:sugar ABC transporter permease [Hyphomicrobiales bacterium]